ncbi:MAG: diguanylate cyclase [Desulfobulbaceae bacterium]|nr:diguanylate cyclase [Desulfobulbaceae bacterium]
MIIIQKKVKLPMQRILVAGKNIINSPETRLLLEAKGYQAILCEKLQDAVSMVLEDPPDLLITEKGFAGSNHDHELIMAAKACLQKANIPILLVLDLDDLKSDMNWDYYPVDDFIVKPVPPETLLARIELAESRMVRVFDNNPLSKLPGNTSILRSIQRTIDSDESYGVCYIDIDNFKPYNDRYGFSRGDEVLLMVARITVNVVEELARDGSFVGHIGGDDFVFIVREENLKPVCERLVENFERVKNMFLSPEDIKAGAFIGEDRQGNETRFDLLSLSVAVVTIGGENKYEHFGEVSVVASQIKHYAKTLDGSNYVIDRRER